MAPLRPKSTAGKVVTEQNARWPKILVEVFVEVAIVTP
jgi:hypothetical protein